MSWDTAARQGLCVEHVFSQSVSCAIYLICITMTQFVININERHTEAGVPRRD